MNWITSNLLHAVSDFMSGILDVYGSIISNIFETVADANVNNSLVTNCSNFMILFSLAALGLVAAKQILEVYVFQTSGDADAEPLQLVVRMAQACAVICSSTWIFNELLRFSKMFASDFLSSAHEGDNISGHMQSQIFKAMDTIQSQSVGFMLTLLIVLIGFIIFCVVAGIRGAELTLMKILAPLFAIDLITTNRERWNHFFTTYLVTFLSYSIQLLCFKMCSMTFMAVDYNGSYGVKFITVIGWLVLMIRAPKWMEKFVYSSGVGGAASSAVRVLPFFLLRR